MARAVKGSSNKEGESDDSNKSVFSLKSLTQRPSERKRIELISVGRSRSTMETLRPREGAKERLLTISRIAS